MDATSSESDFQSFEQRLSDLGNDFGSYNELEGERALLAQLAAKGYRLLDRPRPLAVDGEVDTVVPVEREGQKVWVLLSSKTRLRRGNVTGGDRQLRDSAFQAALRAQQIEPPFLVCAFGRRVYDDAVEAGRAAGIGILDPYGEVVEPTLRSA
ncbi:MAG: hypothetical protein HY690_10930 [Chloroflexi bacterium]|nr:hypothetical protein [Chloroflexota bacterium]